MLIIKDPERTQVKLGTTSVMAGGGESAEISAKSVMPNKEREMKTYMASDGDPQDGAVLVFAHKTKEAKKVAWPVIRGWNLDAEYIHLRVVLLRDKPFLFDEADPEALISDKAHAIDDPIVCSSCELWGNKLDEHGYCENCRGDDK